MHKVMEIGNSPWSREEILDGLEEFSILCKDRPIKENTSGMRAPHLFAVWFIVKTISPELIVESGVWKGQSTWLLEKACPEARIVSIDLDLSNRQYISDKVEYSDRDFSEHDWSEIPDNSLVMFDDHQNAYKRLMQCKWFGFKHVVFEDNYPVPTGDCYSLKKAFSNVGFDPVRRGVISENSNSVLPRVRRKIANILGVNEISCLPQYNAVRVLPNEADSKMLQKHIEIYYEFPPVFKPQVTRWGDIWDENVYPTPAPLLNKPVKEFHKIYFNEAVYYTWICYVKLKLGQ